MNDPYKTLGVSPNASDDEIKSAYKNLAKKYHPDNYNNSPLSDLAEEKMKEINEAYDTVMNSRKNGQNDNSYSYSAGSSYSNGTQFADIRNLINNKRFVEAEELLNGIQSQSRDSEWYFLKGCVLYYKGWLDDAMQHIQTAVNMNPGNPEYRAFYNRLAYQQNGGMHGYPGGYNTTYNTGGCSGCDLCSGLICADCCAESCCGVDICGCC